MEDFSELQDGELEVLQCESLKLHCRGQVLFVR